MTPGSKNPELTPAIGVPSLLTTLMVTPDSTEVSVLTVLIVVTMPKVALLNVAG